MLGDGSSIGVRGKNVDQGREMGWLGKVVECWWWTDGLPCLGVEGWMSK